MNASENLSISPLVTESTRAQSENVETIVNRLRSGRVIIPDYQRDAEQWHNRKESLFIESILNNLTIPAFFFAAREDHKIEVVDGQQRLNTIRKYFENKFSLANDDSMVYLTPQSVHYQGKTFSELPEILQGVFNDYPLTIIYLPQGIELGTKLEIFRRINEGGTPLTAQDIRLAYYSESVSVTMIRLAGLHGSRDTENGLSAAENRMLESATKRGIQNPWDKCPDAYSQWAQWWSGREKARGQVPSEMFLWYLVTRNRKILNSLLSTPSSMNHLPITFRGKTEEALDIYCAQLRSTDEEGGTSVFPTGDELQEAFNTFADWIRIILSQELAGIGVDKYKQIALVISAFAEQSIQPSSLSHDAWDELGKFIRRPRRVADVLFKSGMMKTDYPESHGRWNGENGQFSQCIYVNGLVSVIIKKNSPES